MTLARMQISDIPGTLTLAFVGSNPASPAKKINSVSAIGTEFVFFDCLFRVDLCKVNITAMIV